MSQFEYISIALALIYALVVGRLLTGLTPSLEETRRYSIQVAWIVVFLLACVIQWWGMWRYNAEDVAWTPIGFLVVLSLPSILFVRAGLLLGPNPDSVESFRSHFYERRISFFALGVVEAALAALSPWVVGIAPWFTLNSGGTHQVALVLAVVSVTGLALKNPKAQAAAVFGNFLLAVTGYYFIGN